MRKPCAWAFVFLSLLFAFVGMESRADELATLTGFLTDPKGFRVPAAKVQVTNIETNVSYSSETNEEGLYRVSGIPTGTYRIVIQKAGFKTIVKQGVDLHIQDVIAVNFQLELGSMAESVTVEEGAPMVNTTSAEVSMVVDQSYVRNMPLNGRSFQDLILLAPGTVTQSPQINRGSSNLGRTGEFSVDGQRTESNYYTVDGVSANVGAASGNAMYLNGGASGSLAASTALGTTQALVSVDALQEFRVQSSSYSAEYGRNPGGQFAFETKSGTNQWHGTAFDYLRNGFVDAQDWFNDYFDKPGPPIRQNDFGGTLGGPVWIPGLYKGENRTFFFVSYEGLRLLQPQAATANFVPDTALRANTPAPLNQVLNAFALPTLGGIDDTVNGVAQFIGGGVSPASLDSTSIRLDHIVNDKLRLFFRFSDTSSGSSVRGSAQNSGTPTQNQTSDYILRTYTAGVSSAFSRRLGNELRFNFTSNAVTSRQVIDSFGGSTPIDLQQLSGLGAGSQVGLTCYCGPYIFSLDQFQQVGAQKQWNFLDTASLLLGRHQLKFGVDYRRLAPFGVPLNPNLQYLYFSTSSLKANNPFIILDANAPAYPLYRNFSAFVQDQWKISRRLSLSLGLRWDVNPAPSVTQGLKGYTLLGTSPSNWAVAPQGTPLWKTTWYNFTPRLGVAYVLHDAPGWETVVRGGGGVFFDTGQQTGSQSFQGPGFFAFSSPAGVFPLAAAGLVPPIVNPPVAPYSAGPFGFASHLQLPYAIHWNVSIEQGLSTSQALALSYVGSHSGRLLQANQFNGLNNPNATNYTFTLVENGLTSDYDAFQVQFRRRLARGLTALASYTWSHCIDYGSQNFFFGYQRGNCDFDIRHNLSAALSYDVPNVGHTSLTNAVLHHWGLDGRFAARTGFPVTLNGNTILDPSSLQYSSAGLNLVSGQSIYLYGSNCTAVLQALGSLRPGQGCPGGRAVNPGAFTNVSSGLGDAPRNFVRGFGSWQMDLAARRDFPIYERLKLQFRAEAFNLFNHPNFGLINATCRGKAGVPGCTNLGFGLATATLASSPGVLSPLYRMGGPRSMQFALKLIF